MTFKAPITADDELNTFLVQIQLSLDDILFLINKQSSTISGTFTSADGKTITVVNGIITGIV
jgi:hypothetical protein